jgi:hypothetical protein
MANVTVSEIRWRQPMFGKDFDRHTFRVGDRVRIARLVDSITSRAIIDHRGIVIEIDDMSPSMVEMRCATCNGIHTMHEQELDFLGADLIRLLQEKAGIPDDPEVINESNENLEDFLAVGMHRAGLLRISVHDKAAPAGDPRYPRPVWQKYVFGFIGRLAPMRVYNDALVKIADQAGGYLVEWAVFSHESGYDAVTMPDDLNTLTLEMPIRALMVAKATTNMTEYDEIKDMVAYWLQDKHQIDIGGIFRALRDVGFGIGGWRLEDTKDGGSPMWRAVLSKDVYEDSKVSKPSNYSLTAVWKNHNGAGFEEFRRWAKLHWEWEGNFNVHIDDEGNNLDNGYDRIQVFNVTKKPGEPPEIEEEEDVPF